MTDMDKRKILEMVFNNQISPEEGLSLYMRKKTAKCPVEKSGDIAVIGISGQFPGAENIDEFWDNLVNGTCSVGEITRWDMNALYNQVPKAPNKINSKWGGLLNNIDCFDPLFFELSPRQAEFMEPRQRLFLQEAWRALEDAAYSRKQLEGKKCGVFVGCEGGTDYFKDLKRESMNAYAFLGNSNSILASRIAYFLDLQGPSVTIDTACSSSLVAIHLACESIKTGSCDIAIAGGVNIMTSPEAYIFLTNMGMLSPEGKCKAFDDTADGFVPGEAVCALILKPLAKALEDSDHIYGVIKGSAVNQDGKTNGITAPSTISQARLEEEVYKTCGINPETISYVEAHGTGTKLGDPIEIEALKVSFGAYTNKRQFCAIGSVKSNIGHTAAASGAVGLIKILLGMKYRQIPATLHCKKENEQIDFEGSPFYVATQLKPWEPLEGCPRRAALNSFGHSGTNCHMVIEEAPVSRTAKLDKPLPYYLITFSGRTEEALNQRIKDFSVWFEKSGDCVSIKDIAYTLLVGRSHYNIRAALVVKDSEHLRNMLAKLTSGGYPSDYLTGGLAGERPGQVYTSDDIGAGLINELSVTQNTSEQEYKKKLLLLAQLYINRNDLEWEKLYSGMECFRIPVPTYPFSKERYWLSESDRNTVESCGCSSMTVMDVLIDRMEPIHGGYSYKKVFSGEEFFLKDHSEVLPAVVYMEMVREVGNITCGEGMTVKTINNMVWARPLIVHNGSREVSVDFYPCDGGARFEVRTIEDNQKVINSQGTLTYGIREDYSSQKRYIDVNAVIKRCHGGKDGARSFYKNIEKLGSFLGTGFRGMQEFYSNEEEAISCLGIPEELEESFGQYCIHPTLTDGGVQTVVNLAYNTIADKDTIYLPFAMGKLEILNPELRVCYAYVNRADDKNKTDAEAARYNVFYLSEHGEVALCISDFSIRPFHNMPKAKPEGDDESSVVYIQSNYERVDCPSNNKLNGDILILAEDEQLYTALKKEAERQNRCIALVKPGKCYKVSENMIYEIDPGVSDHYMYLIEDLHAKGLRLENIIHMWSESIEKWNRNTVNDWLERGLYTMFYLTKALLSKYAGNEMRFIYIYNSNCSQEQAPFDCINGFFRTVGQEIHNFKFKTVAIKQISGMLTVFENGLAQKLINELNTEFENEAEILYEENARFVKGFKECYPDREHSNPVTIREGGVYLITGGMGGLGMIFAEYLSKKAKISLILTGRSELSSEKKAKINEVEASGSKVVYIEADISKSEEVNRLISEIKQRFSKINGVIQCAGIIRDGLVESKEIKDIEEVLGPKVFGTLNLYEAIKKEKLDFFALFSSITAVLGNPGQCDYAFANSFMDKFAAIKALENPGFKIISINWPLWEDGGMKIDEQTRKLVFDLYGIKAISRETGLRIFEKALALPESRLTAIGGDAVKIRKMLRKGRKNFFGSEKGIDKISEKSKVMISGQWSEDRSYKRFQEDVLAVISDVARLDTKNIDINSKMSSFGFDSIMFTELANKINDKFKIEITPAIFFGHSSPGTISRELFDNHKNNILGYYDVAGIEQVISKEKVKHKPVDKEGLSIIEKMPKCENTESNTFSTEKSSVYGEPVAIIGISGIMPSSKDIDVFWKNLAEGKNLISEIPIERWDWREYYGDPIEEDNKTNIKWGGFMEEIDKFDPLFFNISPRDAEMMDPQERMVVQTTWKAIEDAGYKPSDLAGTRTGVFIGVTNGDYKELLLGDGKPVALTNSLVANLVSYLFDFQGPSESVDTACSSSLVAIHRAVEQIQMGICEMAVAGGVNIIASPNLYLVQSRAGMLSKDGKCKTFDKNANGYVRGEGVGVIILKPLSKAKADGDCIRGIIRGSAVTHNGHGSAMTVPSSAAQAKAIVNAFDKAGIDPSTISYIEAHGTGTKLGDPVEIEGIKKAFKELYTKWNRNFSSGSHIGIGTAKTNIGHLESAAGIAGIIKVLKSMEHKTIPSIINFEDLNPHIQLNDTPFYIANKTMAWECSIDEAGQQVPRRAGVSSFGIGGVNAHVVLEEYENPFLESSDDGGRHIIILSAKTSGSLKANAKALHDFVKDTMVLTDTLIEEDFLTKKVRSDVLAEISDILRIDEKDIDLNAEISELGFSPVAISEFANRMSIRYDIEIPIMLFCRASTLQGFVGSLIDEHGNNLSRYYDDKIVGMAGSGKEKTRLIDIAYTLQNGREAMEQRLAVMAGTKEELLAGLETYLKGSTGMNEGVMVGSKVEKDNDFCRLISGWIGEKIVDLAVEKNDMEKLALLWVKGADIPWQRLYINRKARRVPLPTYEFERRRCWYTQESCNGRSILNKKSNTAEYFKQEENSGAVIEREYSSKPVEELKYGYEEIENFIRYEICNLIREVLKLESGEVNLNKELTAYGVDSITSVKINNRIRNLYEIDIDNSGLIEKYNSINSIVKYLITMPEVLNGVSRRMETEIGDEMQAKDRKNTFKTCQTTVYDRIEELTIPCGELNEDTENNQDINPEQLIEDLIKQHIALWVEDGKLIVRAPKGKLTREITDILSDNINVLVNFMGNRKYVPLSLVQQKYWSLECELKEASFFKAPLTIYSAVRFKGKLEVNALKSALEKVVQQHDILRAVFCVLRSIPVQVIKPDSSECILPTIDLSDISDPIEREAEAQRILNESDLYFDLSEGPNIKIQLIKISATEHILTTAVHHIIFDAFSYLPYVQGFIAYYKEITEGKTIKSMYPVQYLQYTLLEAGMQTEYMKYEKFWRSYLEGASPVVKLPVDFEEPTVNRMAGMCENGLLPAVELNEFKEELNRFNATLFVGVLSVIEAVLHKWSGQTDFTIGTLVQNRNTLNFEDTIGDFTSILPIRSRLSRDQSFTSLVNELKVGVNMVLEHRNYPEYKIYEIIGGNFNVIANQPYYADNMAINDELAASIIDSSVISIAPDIRFDWYEVQDGLQITCVYNVDLYKPETIKFLVKKILRVFKQIIINPDIKLEDLTFLEE